MFPGWQTVAAPIDRGHCFRTIPVVKQVVPRPALASGSEAEFSLPLRCGTKAASPFRGCPSGTENPYRQ
jgi:hypothetical protein